jgi:hypothetical protein
MVSLVACASKSPGGFRCSPDGQVCVEIHTDEPIVYGAPVIVTISVTSEKYISYLGISLTYDADDVIEGIENWEDNLQNSSIIPGGAGWGIEINANQTLSFQRTFYLPQREGYFTIIASITDRNTFRASDELIIAMTTQGGTVYLANTPVPHTTGPLPTIEPHLLETLLAMPTYTPWSTITSHPAEITNTPPAYPPPPTPDLDRPGEPYP